MTAAPATSAPSLADVLHDYRIVDLSLTLDRRFPCVWPGHMPFEHTVHNWYAESSGPGPRLRSSGPYYTCWITLDEHVGTHFDAPPHFIPPPDSGLDHANEFGAMYGDRVPLDQLQGQAVVVDVRPLNEPGRNGVSPLITPEFVQQWEEEHGAISAGEVVLFAGGWDAFYVPFPDGARYVYQPVVTRDAPGWPAPSAETVVYLYDRGVRTIGTDGPSIGSADEGPSMHWAGLERGMTYVESLAHLHDLPVRGSFFVFLPVKVAESSGGSGRALAYVPKNGGAS